MREDRSRRACESTDCITPRGKVVELRVPFKIGACQQHRHRKQFGEGAERLPRNFRARLLCLEETIGRATGTDANTNRSMAPGATAVVRVPLGIDVDTLVNAATSEMNTDVPPRPFICRSVFRDRALAHYI